MMTLTGMCRMVSVRCSDMTRKEIRISECTKRVPAEVAVRTNQRTVLCLLSHAVKNTPGAEKVKQGTEPWLYSIAA